MISVIIPHANSRSLLHSLLLSLELQQISVPFEVLVVCNPELKYQHFPDWTFSYKLLWLTSPAGANHARQKGADHSRGEILIFLDDDCVITSPLFLARHLEHHRHESISAVGGYYQLSNNKTLWGETYNYIQNTWLDNHRLPGGFCAHMLGGNSSYKRSIFIKNAFDVSLRFGGTETEFQLRLLEQGHKLQIFNDIPVEHDGKLSFKDFTCKAFKQGIGAAYISKHRKRAPRYLFYSENKRQCPSRFATWIYDSAFSAGQDFYTEKQKLTCPQRYILFKTCKKIFESLFAKDSSTWREYRALFQILSLNLLSSPRKSDSGPSGPQDSELHKD